MIENRTRDEPPPRDTRTALWRGWRCRCPACGEGAMFASYLVVARTCPHCGTELYHHRADDGPAWATILITGHILAPLMLTVFFAFHPPGWAMAIGFSVVFVLLSLWMLPRLKGCFVAIQWATRMYGFGDDGDAFVPGT